MYVRGEVSGGCDLARAFYEEVVAPIVGGTPHAAAFLGWGSDVLGYDSERSTDHGWGPRLQVFVGADDVARVAAEIEARLPDEFGGWPVRFGWDEVAPTHHVAVVTLADWLEEVLGFDATQGISAQQWLSTPQQLLLGVTAGAVFHDDLGELTAVREALAWYPDDVWLWLLACQWRRIDQEEPFVGRTAEAGDELGSRVLAARLVRDFMRLGFLLERRYAPYGKWLGTAFARLDVHAAIGDALRAALDARVYAEREAALVAAVEELARRQNALGRTEQVDATARLFHSRPYRVLGSGRFVDACLERVADPWLRSLPLIGAIDQWVDSTDVLSSAHVSQYIGSLYSGTRAV